MSYFTIEDEIRHPFHEKGDWNLNFQLVTLHQPDEEPQPGVRFMWRRGERDLMSSRPCRIDSLYDVITLLEAALDRRWGDVDGGVHGVRREPVTITINDKTWELPGDPPKDADDAARTIDVVINGVKHTVPVGPDPQLATINGVTVQLAQPTS